MAHVFQFERLSIRTRSFKHFKVTKTASGRFSISQRVNYYNIAVGWGGPNSTNDLGLSPFLEFSLPVVVAYTTHQDPVSSGHHAVQLIHHTEGSVCKCMGNFLLKPDS